MHSSIDLFAGCGGLSKGLENAGFNCLWANEFDQGAAKTFKENFSNTTVSSDDIRIIDAEAVRLSLGLQRGQLALLAGGFPCQGFSTYGKRDANDERNLLFRDFIRFAKEFAPKIVLIENVVGLISMANGDFLKAITESLRELKYTIHINVLQSADFGVPQLRKRVFIVGVKDGVDFHFPQISHSKKMANNYITVSDAISDLPSIALKPSQAHESLEYPNRKSLSTYAKSMRFMSNKLTDHSAKQLLSVRKLRIMLMKQGDYGRDLRSIDANMEVPNSLRSQIVKDCGLRRSIEGCRKQDREKETTLRLLLEKENLKFFHLYEFIEAGGFANKFRRLNQSKPSHTLVAHMARDCSDFIHPTKDRFISVREAARLQSFCDNFKFLGSQFSQFKQIGNAVPPILSQAVGKSIISSLS